MRLWSRPNSWRTPIALPNLHRLSLLQVEVVMSGCLTWVAKLAVWAEGLERDILLLNRVVRWSGRVHSLRMIRTIWLNRGQKLLALSVWAIRRITSLISYWGRGCGISGSNRQTTFVVGCCRGWGSGLRDGSYSSNSLFDQALWFDSLVCATSHIQALIGVVPVLNRLKWWLTLSVLSKIDLALIHHVATAWLSGYLRRCR